MTTVTRISDTLAIDLSTVSAVDASPNHTGQCTVLTTKGLTVTASPEDAKELIKRIARRSDASAGPGKFGLPDRIDMDVWSKARTGALLKGFTGQTCVAAVGFSEGGIDLALTFFVDGRAFVFPFFFRGPHPEAVVATLLRTLTEYHTLSGVYCDRWFVEAFKARVQMPASVPVIATSVGYKDMSVPVKRMLEMLNAGSLLRGTIPSSNSPQMLDEQVSNTRFKIDPVGNMTFDREASVGEIGGVVCLAMTMLGAPE